MFSSVASFTIWFHPGHTLAFLLLNDVIRQRSILGYFLDIRPNEKMAISYISKRNTTFGIYLMNRAIKIWTEMIILRPIQWRGMPEYCNWKRPPEEWDEDEEQPLEARSVKNNIWWVNWCRSTATFHPRIRSLSLFLSLSLENVLKRKQLLAKPECGTEFQFVENHLDYRSSLS